MSNNNNIVVAITVTFNSSHYVIRALEALKVQKRKVDFIIVVDNNSKQDEKEKVQNYIQNLSNTILLSLEENKGGAGGFEAGMKYAKKKFNPDWYWLMDDDAFPEIDCLEKLLSYKNTLKQIGALVPAIWGIDKKQYQLYHHKKLSKFLTSDIPITDQIDNLKEVTEIDANAFVGPLISQEAVEKVGIADGSLFIYGDDLEYTYRISRVLKIYLIKAAKINHQDILMKSNILDPKAWWKDYYNFRNRLFFIKEYSLNRKNRIIGKIIIGLKILRRIKSALVEKEYKGYRKKRVDILGKAWSDGVNNRRGKTVDPVEFCKNL